jgi:ABC-2 type transport system ATP-binding protein
VRSLVKRENREVNAVDGLTFAVEEGEVVGFLGANGAGKTTTLKMLAGVLHPSGGDVRVLGRVPSQRRRDHLCAIALLVGNRNQLQWDLPAADSFELNRAVYRIPWVDFRRTRDELVEMLDAGHLLAKPVRNLSLGERMKVEFIGSLLHTPNVLFLDEPTVGLDLTMQRRIRTFIRDYNIRHGATILLTSHYMADIEALCQRVIIIDRGRLLLDDRLARLTERFSSDKEIEFTMAEGTADPSCYGQLVRRDGDRVRVRVTHERVAEVVGALITGGMANDLTVEQLSIEDIVEMLLSGRAVVPGGVR